MKKSISLVSIVMVVMVLIGTMMVPAHADYTKTATFEERFEVLFDLYLEREGLEDYLVIEQFDEVEDGHVVTIKFTDTAVEQIKVEENIESDDVYVRCVLFIENNRSYNLFAELYVDGYLFDIESDYGIDIIEDMF